MVKLADAAGLKLADRKRRLEIPSPATITVVGAYSFEWRNFSIHWVILHAAKLAH
jgi:hypothetical protein